MGAIQELKSDIVAGSRLFPGDYSAGLTRVGHRGDILRHPRDDRIRSLDAELRIARSDSEKSKTESKEQSKEFKQAEIEIEQLKGKLEKECEATATLRRDLKESVKKTRELRAELTDRATENIKSEVKLREVETELSVAQASTDLIATGVLDYSVAPGEEDDDDAQIVKTNF